MTLVRADSGRKSNRRPRTKARQQHLSLFGIGRAAATARSFPCLKRRPKTELAEEHETMRLQDHQVLQRRADGTAHGLPVGGPYELEGARDILVGDLWVLGGQSNMEGLGDMVDLEPPIPYVRSFQSREEWAVAEEPLHWLAESPRSVHHLLWGAPGVPESMPPRDPGRPKGAGLGLTFAKTYYAATGVPVGLIPCAHGGTTMDQWNPALEAEGEPSLYGAACARVE